MPLQGLYIYLLFLDTTATGASAMGVTSLENIKFKAKRMSVVRLPPDMSQNWMLELNLSLTSSSKIQAHPKAVSFTNDTRLRELIPRIAVSCALEDAPT